MRAGWVEFLEGEVELRGVDGPVYAYSWSRAIGEHPPRQMVIAGALRVSKGADGNVTPDHGPVEVDRFVISLLDHDWCVQDVAANPGSLFGRTRGHEGTVRFDDLVHPADASALATLRDPAVLEPGPATATLRLRGRDERWVNALVSVSRLYGRASTPLVAVIDVAGAQGAVDAATDRANRVEASLARIASEVRAAGVNLGTDVRFERTDLSARENEIARRLLAGQRVPTIARELFISASTVRNHLSGIFRRFGVHSQADFIEKFRPSDDST
jgi:DNA-binding CsgD family transcriptional regulator